MNYTDTIIIWSLGPNIGD